MVSVMNLTAQTEPEFKPGPVLRNTHFQTIFSSFGPRALILKNLSQSLKSSEQKIELDCGDGVTLAGYYNQVGDQPAEKMAILIHGWEGCHGSSYMVSMTSSLVAKGIDVFRLNMRDHGDSHHLNEGIFNSTLLDEVMGAITNIQARLPHTKSYLMGFSLGGNFCLRVAANAHDKAISLEKVIVFCPVIHAGESNDALLRKRNWLYGKYFIHRWKKSLFKKLEYFPDYEYGAVLHEMKTLEDMNERLVPKYTGFKLEEYFDAYAITGDRLANTICPCYLHFSKDDMIIPVQDVDKLSRTNNLDITVTEHGGHCGYLMNWKFDSWQDARVIALIEQA